MDGNIIIKKIKKISGGHHGGAWKVAYADFVTAMMAFFLLLWLINVTTPAQKMGLAEYFTPTIGIKDSMGIGFKGGKTPSTNAGRANTDLSAPGLVEGQIKQGPVQAAPDVSKPAKPDPDAENTSTGKKARINGQDSPESVDGEDADMMKATVLDIKQSLEKDPDLRDFKNNIIVEEVPEGLKIDMIDDQKTPMFLPGSATLTDTGKKVIDSMANIIAKTPNNIVLNGHTDAGKATVPQYTNWELSADRANAVRRFLMTTQLEHDRVLKVVGYADKQLLTPEDPANSRNRRVTIILVRGSYFRDPKVSPAERSMLSLPNAEVKKDKPKEPAPAAATAPKVPSMFDPR
jgi:chemotaxis protein MotB